MFFQKRSVVSEDVQSMTDELVMALARGEVKAYLAKTFSAQYAIAFDKNATDAEVRAMYSTMKTLANYR